MVSLPAAYDAYKPIWFTGQSACFRLEWATTESAKSNEGVAEKIHGSDTRSLQDGTGTAEELVSGATSLHSARFTPDGQQLVCLSHQAAVDSGCHSASAALLKLPWPVSGVRSCRPSCSCASIDTESTRQPSNYRLVYNCIGWCACKHTVGTGVADCHHDQVHRLQHPVITLCCHGHEHAMPGTYPARLACKLHSTNDEQQASPYSPPRSRLAYLDTNQSCLHAGAQPETVVPIVPRPAEGQFPGLYLGALPEQPFVGNGLLALTTQWGSSAQVVVVDLDQGTVASTQPPASAPDARGSWAYLTSGHGMA